MASSDTTTQKSSRRKDLVFVGIHLLFLLGLSLAVFIIRSQNDDFTGSAIDIAMVFGVGVGIVAVLTVSVLVASLKPALPFLVMIGDMVLAGAYVYIGDGDPMMVIGAAGFFSVMGILWMDSLLAGIHVVLVLATTLGVALYLHVSGTPNQSLDMDTVIELYALPVLILSCFGISVGIWQNTSGDHRVNQLLSLNKEVQSQGKQLGTMKERMRAIYEMSSVLGSTLDFEHVLEAALDAGELSMHKTKGQRSISMVLLFRYNENELYVAGSRGLKATDAHVTVSGGKGLIGKVLADSEPIMSDEVKGDSELNKFAGLHGIRSVVILPLHAHYDNFGVLVYGSSHASAFRDDALDVLNTIGVQATTALQNSTLYHTLLDEKEMIYQLEEDARKSLVRDLHDIPTQTIATVTTRLRLLQRFVQTQMENPPKDLIEDLDAAEKLATRASVEIRHVLFTLRPLALETQGLVAALEQLAEKMETTYKQACVVKIHPDIEQYLDETKQGAMFFLVEEAVNNARKYAEANMITVQARIKDGMIALRIADNGKGFDIGDVTNNYSRRGSFGMVNMRERADTLDGIFKMDSKKGKGTTITVMIPMDKTKTTTTTGVYRQLPKTKLAASVKTRLE